MANKRKDLVITNAVDLKEIVDNIAANYGISTTAYVKQKLRALVQSEPDHMKKPRPKE